jgi:hypothetical protein
VAGEDLHQNTQTFYFMEDVVDSVMEQEFILVGHGYLIMLRNLEKKFIK